MHRRGLGRVAFGVRTGVLIAATTLPTLPAFAQEPPPVVTEASDEPGDVKRLVHREPIPARPATSGVGLIITGSIFLGVGALNAAVAPVCLAVAPDDLGACYGLTAGAGGVSAGIGVALLAAGLLDRDATEKRAERTVGFDVVDVPGGGLLAVRGIF